MSYESGVKQVTGNENMSTPVAQSLLAKVQLGLPGTVTKLSAKMRFIDRIAPLLRQGGVVLPVEVMQPLTLRVASIATAHKTTPAFGGVLYSAGALRQDIYIEDGSIYQTYQDSVVDIDETDDVDVTRKIKYIHIMQVYRMLEELIQDDEHPRLVIVDTPLVLERSDDPPDYQEELKQYYKKCLEVTESFWHTYKEYIYPFNPNGLYLASLNNRRLGAVFYGLASEKREFILDEIDNDVFGKLESSFERVKKVGMKKLLNGVLTNRSRTAAYEHNLIFGENKIKPEILQEIGLVAFHLRAGLRTLPYQVEVFGSKRTWEIERLDELASYIVSLITVDQPKALPLPLWYAKYALKPVGSGAILQYYKKQAREMIKNEEVENIWKEELDIFEGDAN